MKKLILLNGPIGCGKSKATEYLHEIYELKDRQCKDRLHELTMQFFGVEPEAYWSIYNVRELKEAPHPAFVIEGGAYNDLMLLLHGDGTDQVTWEPKKEISLRHAMIYTSEILVKPTFGKDYFGAYRVAAMDDNEIAIDDSTGFEEELYPAIEQLGQDNIILIRIHGRDNGGADSRGYIRDGVIDNTVDIENNGTLAEYLEKTHAAVASFLAEPAPRQFKIS